MVQVETLRRMIAEPTSTTYSDAMLESFIDEAGGDLNLAAARIWDEKAANVAVQHDFQADGTNMSRSQLFDHYKRTASLFRSRRRLAVTRLEGD